MTSSGILTSAAATVFLCLVTESVSAQAPSILPDPFIAGPSFLEGITAEVTNINAQLNGEFCTVTAGYKLKTKDNPATAHYKLQLREYIEGPSGPIMLAGISIPFKNTGGFSKKEHNGHLGQYDL